MANIKCYLKDLPQSACTQTKQTAFIICHCKLRLWWARKVRLINLWLKGRKQSNSCSDSATLQRGNCKFAICKACHNTGDNCTDAVQAHTHFAVIYAMAKFTVVHCSLNLMLSIMPPSTSLPIAPKWSYTLQAKFEQIARLLIIEKAKCRLNRWKNVPWWHRIACSL